MADIGKTVYMGITTPYITRADGYEISDGTAGYSYNISESVFERDKGNTSPTGTLYPSNILPSPPIGSITYYVMRGKDPDCGPVTYRTWTVENAPDTTGAQYIGTKCGANPLEDIVVILTYKS